MSYSQRDIEGMFDRNRSSLIESSQCAYDLRRPYNLHFGREDIQHCIAAADDLFGSVKIPSPFGECTPRELAARILSSGAHGNSRVKEPAHIFTHPDEILNPFDLKRVEATSALMQEVRDIFLPFFGNDSCAYVLSTIMSRARDEYCTALREISSRDAVGLSLLCPLPQNYSFVPPEIAAHSIKTATGICPDTVPLCNTFVMEHLHSGNQSRMSFGIPKPDGLGILADARVGISPGRKTVVDGCYFNACVLQTAMMLRTLFNLGIYFPAGVHDYLRLHPVNPSSLPAEFRALGQHAREMGALEFSLIRGTLEHNIVPVTRGACFDASSPPGTSRLIDENLVAFTESQTTRIFPSEKQCYDFATEFAVGEA